MSSRPCLAAGAAAGLLAVGLGAFGAHALGTRLAGKAGELWHTAENYQFVHALALIVLAALRDRLPRKWLGVSGALFAAGIVLFCGSLYALALGAPRWTGWITPVGGTAFILAWGVLLAAALKTR